MGKNLRNLIKHSYPVGNKEKLYLVIRSLNICTFGCTRRIVSHRHKFAYIIYQLICNFLPGILPDSKFEGRFRKSRIKSIDIVHVLRIELKKAYKYILLKFPPVPFLSAVFGSGTISIL